METENQTQNHNHIEPVDQPVINTPTPKSFWKKIILPVIIVLVLGGAGAGYYFYKQSSSTPADTEAANQKEVQALIAQISKLIVLPTDETPTIATVSDPEKLKNQAFFANAKRGDKVLIFTNAKKAILYDPVAKKIIEVAPINLNSNETPLPSSSSPTPTPTKLK